MKFTMFTMFMVNLLCMRWGTSRFQNTCGVKLRLNLLIPGDKSHQTLDSLLELAVLGCVNERVEIIITICARN